MSTLAQAAGIDVVAFNGWQRNLRLRNGTAELIITLEVGPRILSYTKLGGFNPLKIYADQAGTSGEAAWRNRGGHRLWTAPENPTSTYCPDNAPVGWQQRGSLDVRLTPPPDTAVGLQKQIDVALDATGTGVTIAHRVTRTGATPVSLAPWALTVMTPAGVAIVPQPPVGEHPRDLQPNRSLALWPYTDMGDPRWHFGRRYILLRHDPGRGPTKIGLALQAGWCGYLVGGVFFLKRFPWQADTVYPDFGCNCEVFANEEMLELESLGPLARLNPGRSVEHVERWELHDGPGSLAAPAEESIAEFLGPIVRRGAPAP